MSPGLISVLFSVRSDLFFGKKLILAADLDKVDALAWGDVFLDLKKIDADGLFLTSGVDPTQSAIAQGPRGGNARDAAGSIYGMLNSWDTGFNGLIYFDLDKFADIEDAHRLICKMRPELKNRVRFFIKSSGFR